MLHVGDPKGYKSAVSELKNQSESLVNKQVCACAWTCCCMTW